MTWWEKGDADAPEIWQESLAAFFIYPAVFKGDEVRLSLYADKGKRNQSHVYERVLIYPLGRVTGTPLNVFTPIDLMRETLGQGPCEYILDVAGIKPRQPGGDRPTLAYATCGLWDSHIEPIVVQLKKKPDGSFEPLDEKTKTHLIQALEDMWYFVHAVHDRLREYRKWGADMEAFCKQESAKSGAVKQVADQTLAQLDRLNADIARHKFEGPGSEAYWKDRVPELIEMVKADNYTDVGSVKKIRDLGDQQDERVSRCRQYVKAMLQETVFQDTSDPGAGRSRRRSGIDATRCCGTSTRRKGSRRSTMTPSLKELGLDHLSAEDRLEIAEAIWESVAREVEAAPLPAAQRGIEAPSGRQHGSAHSGYSLGADQGAGVGEVTAVSIPVVFRSEAESEFDEAFDWYDARRIGLGLEFASEVQAVLDAIAVNPLLYAATFADIRKAAVRRFPYCIFYRAHADRIEVIAVFHTSRNPSIWQGRA